jgi:hypothetical protein
VAIGAAACVEEAASRFLNAKKNMERVEELLDTPASLGKALEPGDRRFVAM